MGRRKRSAGSAPTRKRGPNKALQHHFVSEHDWELAQTVVQVVKDLVCQVADEPYGDLTRKRPSFLHVIRKFVKDSVQTVHDAAAAELLHSFSRRTRAVEEPALPYGNDLVWGLVLNEMDKIDKRERARIYSAQKNARIREKKKLEAIEMAALATRTNRHVEGGSSDDECKLKPIPVNPYDWDNPPIIRLPFFLPSPRSDDSDWAVQPVRQTRQRLQPQKVPDPWSISKTRGQTKAHPISNQLPVRARARSRGSAAKQFPTVRSMLNAAKDNDLLCSSQRMHPNVSLTAPSQSKRVESDPFFDFSNMTSTEEQKPSPQLSRSSLRGGRGKGTRGRGRGSSVYRTILNAWNEDPDEYQQHLMAEKIETSGESQESYDDISKTINEVVKKVNEMSELNEGANMKRGVEVKRVQKRGISKPSTGFIRATSALKKMKMEGNIGTIDNDKEGMNSDDDSASIHSIRPIQLDSSFDEPPIQKKRSVTNTQCDDSDSDVLILEEEKRNSVTGRE